MSAAAQMACLECDLILPVPILAEGERAACPRCGHQLASHPRDGLMRSLAFAVGASVFLVIALLFPFMSMKAGGFENSMTLPQTALELYYNGRTALALLVAAFIILVPVVLLCSILAVLVPLIRGWNAPWLVPAGRAIFALSPWSMVEVFVIGVIVSLVKLAAMATIVLGISFWSYVAFSLSLTATLSSLSRMYVWNAIEQVSSG